MPKSQLLDALEARVPFRTARRLLVASDYPTGQGWESVREKLKDSSVFAKANASRLQALYVQSLLATEKAIQLFEVSNSDKALLANKLDARLNASATDPAYQAFPFPMSKTVLNSLSSIDCVVAGKVSIPDGSSFIISYVKEQSFRVAISPTRIAAPTGTVYKELYAIQVDRVQSMDALIIPNGGNKVFLLADNPSGTNTDTLRGSFSRVSTFVKNLVGKDLLNRPMNLYSAIQPFYSDPAVQVSSFDHTSPDSSMRSERMRGSKSCLRDADFHKAGMAAMSGITQAFGIEVLWKLASVGRIEARPELSILGPHSLVYDLNPAIRSAHIGKAATYAELATVIHSLASKV